MGYFTRYLIVMPLCAMLAACADTAPQDGGDILVLGDSVMAWNGSAAIGPAIGATLDRDVVSKAVPGAQFDNSSAFAGAIGFDIRRQFPGGDWQWIVLNGGANDLGADCGCGACGPIVDRLIRPDAEKGTIPEFLKSLRAHTGAQILWMGYYKGNGKGSFEGCRDDLVRMEARIARFATTVPGIHFADSEDVIDPRDPSLFAADNTHPSAKGSALIGAYIGQIITQRSQSGARAL